MNTPANPLRSLLDRIREEKVAPIGIDEYLQVDRLLRLRPDWTEKTGHEQLRYAIASLLATDREQWERVWRISNGYFDDGNATEAVPAITEQGPEPVSETLPLSLAARAGSALAELPRWLLASVILVFALAAGGVALLLLIPKPVSPEPSPAAAAPAPEAQARWRKVPFPEVEHKIPLRSDQPPRALGGGDFLAIGIGSIFMIVGAVWLYLPWHLRARRRERALRNSERGSLLRREMSEDAERNNVQRRLIYHVRQIPPMREDSAADSATILGRLFSREPTEGLDVERTILATVSEGGRFVPIRAQYRIPRVLTILVDVEAGSHPWIGDIEWLLERWRRLGVQFQRFDFQFDPLFLLDESRLPVTLEKLSRRCSGEPLLIISRKLSSRELNREARWRRHVREWPIRAWLDPSPRPPQDLPPGYLREIDSFARSGLQRFPFSEFGLVALAKYLVAEGRGDQKPPWPNLPDLDQPSVRQAIEKWALFGSLVPDANWRQLQLVRESMPDIRAVFSSNRDLQRLIDWAEQRNPDHRAESGDGASLELAPELIEDVIRELRDREAKLPEAERLEVGFRKLLLAQLSPVEPTDPLMRQFWRFKRMQHQMVVDPDAALASFGELIGGPWHSEAVEAVKSELGRDKHVSSLPRTVRDGFTTATDPSSKQVRGGDLIRLPPRLLAGGALAAVVIFGLYAGMMEEIAPVRKYFLSLSYDFTGIFPQNFNLIHDQSDLSKNYNSDSMVLHQVTKNGIKSDLWYTVYIDNINWFCNNHIDFNTWNCFGLPKGNGTQIVNIDIGDNIKVINLNDSSIEMIDTSYKPVNILSAIDNNNKSSNLADMDHVDGGEWKFARGKDDEIEISGKSLSIDFPTDSNGWFWVIVNGNKNRFAIFSHGEIRLQ